MCWPRAGLPAELSRSVKSSRGVLPRRPRVSRRAARLSRRRGGGSAARSAALRQVRTERVYVCSCPPSRRPRWLQASGGAAMHGKWGPRAAGTLAADVACVGVSDSARKAVRPALEYRACAASRMIRLVRCYIRAVSGIALARASDLERRPLAAAIAAGVAVQYVARLEPADLRALSCYAQRRATVDLQVRRWLDGTPPPGVGCVARSVRPGNGRLRA